jgi:hypothetical protein
MLKSGVMGYDDFQKKSQDPTDYDDEEMFSISR